MTATATGEQVAAWVAGRPVPVAEVDARLERLRAGAYGARLPGAHTAEGRNARRWVLQLLCAERLVRDELAARGLPVHGAPQPVRLPRALSLGGVAAAVLAGVPGAGALAPAAPVDAATARSYYDRNRDLYADRGVAYEQARPAIERELRAAADDRAFAAWLERRTAELVRPAPGFEHPAEPGHPDSTHRH